MTSISKHKHHVHSSADSNPIERNQLEMPTATISVALWSLRHYPVLNRSTGVLIRLKNGIFVIDISAWEYQNKILFHAGWGLIRYRVGKINLPLF
jgi:hypothetical protein